MYLRGVMHHAMTAATAALALLGSIGCGPSVRDLVARRAWSEAVQRSNSFDDINTVRSSLRSRVYGRLVVRAYTPAEAATLLGWLPGQLRDGTVSLVAYHAELASPDVTLSHVVLEPAPTARSVACCDDTPGWQALDHPAPRATDADTTPGWMTTARQILSLVATPVQTIVGTVRDVLTLSTGGAVANTPVEGPGVDLSIGALLAHFGLHTSDPPPAESAAAHAAAEAQTRARLHALLATDCAAASPSCVRYALWKPDAPITHVQVSFRYEIPPAPQDVSDDFRIALPQTGVDLATRLRTVFPGGSRALSELPLEHLDVVTITWVPGLVSLTPSGAAISSSRAPH